jgi:hypothetical protein
MSQLLPMTTHICQRLFITLVTDNFQRSFSEFCGNALICNAYLEGENGNGQRITVFLPSTETFNALKLKKT